MKVTFFESIEKEMVCENHESKKRYACLANLIEVANTILNWGRFESNLIKNDN